jgi:hypothetical protein
MASLGHLDLQGAFVNLDPGVRGIYNDFGKVHSEAFRRAGKQTV